LMKEFLESLEDEIHYLGIDTDLELYSTELQEGEHEYKITVQDEHSTIIGETTDLFETTAERAIMTEPEMNYMFSTGQEQDSHHLTVSSFEIYEDLTYIVYLDSDQIDSGNLQKGSQSLSFNLGSLENGQEYEASIIFESSSTDKEEKFEFNFVAGEP